MDVATFAPAKKAQTPAEYSAICISDKTSIEKALAKLFTLARAYTTIDITNLF